MSGKSDVGREIEPLTGRQREVLDLIARGYTNPQIADALGVSIDGAKWHVREILSKLGVDSREEAAEWWRSERSVGVRVRRATRSAVGLGVLRWVAGGAAVALVGALAVVAVMAARGDGQEVVGPEVTATVGASATNEPTVAAGAPPIRKTYSTGETVGGYPALFFVDTNSGAVEEWSFGDDARVGNIALSPSADNRYVAALRHEPDHTLFLIERATGNTQTIDVRRLTLAASEGNRFVFTGTRADSRDPLTVRVLDALTGTTWDTVVTPNGIAEETQALISPDGGSLVILLGNQVYWANVGDAAAQLVLPWFEAVGTLRPESGGVLVSLNYGERYKRIGWDGAVRDAVAPPVGEVSPDGTLIARTELIAPAVRGGWGMGEYPQLAMVVVTDRASGEVRFRARGAMLAEGAPGSTHWLADSSGLVIETGDGFRVMTRDGVVTRDLPPAFRFGWPVPSPDDPDKFALGFAGYVGRDGQPVEVDVDIGSGAWSVGLEAWGRDSAEIRFSTVAGGKGYSRNVPLMPLLIEHDPHEGGLTAVSVVGTGSCLNVREAASTAATAVSCYPDGTHAEITSGRDPNWTTASKEPAMFGAMAPGTDFEPWIHLSMPDGNEGWVSPEFLTWRN
ncbi:MAG: helix-turn-helix domain-containing protein [Tepidiformaceae bacterium]